MKKELWSRLQGYQFENLVSPSLLDQIKSVFVGSNPSMKAFAGKLSRKLGWTTSFAMRAIEEYKRFVYLGIVSDSGVTPSRIIDQVWHEHQLFTRAYREFCNDVLRKNFDHFPELVPIDEQTSAFQDQYTETVALYQREFNSAPPADIWATTKFKTEKKVGVVKRSTAVTQPAPSSPHDSCGSDDLPLHMLWHDTNHHSRSSHTDYNEPIGNHVPDHSPTHDSHHSDVGSDSGSSGDSGGGSSCSSSCGGGGD